MHRPPTGSRLTPPFGGVRKNDGRSNTNAKSNSSSSSNAPPMARRWYVFCLFFVLCLLFGQAFVVLLSFTRWEHMHTYLDSDSGSSSRSVDSLPSPSRVSPTSTSSSSTSNKSVHVTNGDGDVPMMLEAEEIKDEDKQQGATAKKEEEEEGHKKVAEGEGGDDNPSVVGRSPGRAAAGVDEREGSAARRGGGSDRRVRHRFRGADHWALVKTPQPLSDGGGGPLSDVVRIVPLNTKRRSISNALLNNCPVKCVFDAKFGGLVSKFKVDGTDWTIISAMEGPLHYPDVNYKKKKFSAYAVNTMNSEIPHLWLNFTKLYPTMYPAAPFTAESRPSFIATNCGSRNGRETWAKAIDKVFPIAALGPCLHNTGNQKVSRGNWLLNKISVLRRYKFHLAFENQNADHITEKLWATMEAGTIPVYLGDAYAKKWAPKNSIISAHDFKDGTELGLYLKKVSENETLYNSYHAWRYQPPEPRLVELYKDNMRYGLECRMCMWAKKKFDRGDDIHLVRNPLDDVNHSYLDDRADFKYLHSHSHSHSSNSKHNRVGHPRGGGHHGDEGDDGDDDDGDDVT